MSELLRQLITCLERTFFEPLYESFLPLTSETAKRSFFLAREHLRNIHFCRGAQGIAVHFYFLQNSWNFTAPDSIKLGLEAAQVLFMGDVKSKDAVRRKRVVAKGFLAARVHHMSTFYWNEIYGTKKQTNY